MFAAATIAAEVASPDGVELLDKRSEKGGVVGKNAVLEVALLGALRTHPGTRQIGRAEIRLAPVNTDQDSGRSHPASLAPAPSHE